MDPSRMIEDETQSHSRRRASRMLWAALAASIVLAVGCTLFDTVEDRDEEVATWDEDSWGPVLPHKNFPAQCDLCHVTGSWVEIKKDFTFDHGAETGHALMGAHAQARCLRCHNDRGAVGGFAGLGCAGCHVDPHEGKLSSRCDTCHTERNWRPEGLTAQHIDVGFPLFGAHVSTSCDSCHPNARSQDFRGAPSQCIACHLEDQRSALSPDHVLNNMNECDECHVPTRWKGAKFNHETFPLRGAHKTVDCAQCHVGNVFAGTPRDCNSCHAANYAATTNPNHMLAGFSTACETCHTESGWTPSTFAHATWPLTGAHITTACSACHVGNVFAGTPRDCNSCHNDKYVATTNPNHLMAGFSTMCESCHTTTAWGGANFTHSFPRTGPHDVACSECHTTPGNFMAFECTTACHHTQARTDPQHSGEAGYVYASPNCLACHPNGRD